MTRSKSFNAWLTRFDALCLTAGGVLDSKWGEHTFVLQTPRHGRLRVCTHADDYVFQKCGFVNIYLRFEQFENIMYYGNIKSARRMALAELERRLRHIGVNEKSV